MTRDIDVAQRLVRQLARLLQVAPTHDGFASVAPGDMLDALEAVSQPPARIDLRGRDGRDPVFGISKFVPVHGDDALPLPPLDALKAGAGAETSPDLFSHHSARSPRVRGRPASGHLLD